MIRVGESYFISICIHLICGWGNQQECIPFKSEMFFILGDWCGSSTTYRHIYHPTSCNKYVECFSADNSIWPRAYQCSADQCVLDPTAANKCGSCTGAYCPVNFTSK